MRTNPAERRAAVAMFVALALLPSSATASVADGNKELPSGWRDPADGFTVVPEERRAPPAVPSTWRFPAPFTFESPLPEPVTMGFATSVGVGDAGWGVALPLAFEFSYGQTPASDGWAIGYYSFPLLVHSPEGGDTALYAGNLKVGMRGVWKLKIEGLPAAWSAGFDLGLPTAALWSPASDFGPQLGATMFPYDPVTWLSGYLGLAPKALIAVGGPALFGEAAVTTPALVAIAFKDFTTHEILGTWSFAAGSRPIDMMTITVEGGGVHSLKGGDFHGNLLKANQFWAGVGAKIFYNRLDMGLMTLVPIGDPHTLGGSPKFNITLTFGTTRRCCEEGTGRGFW